MKPTMKKLLIESGRRAERVRVRVFLCERQMIFKHATLILYKCQKHQK